MPPHNAPTSVAAASGSSVRRARERQQLVGARRQRRRPRRRPSTSLARCFDNRDTRPQRWRKTPWRSSSRCWRRRCLPVRAVWLRAQRAAGNHHLRCRGGCRAAPAAALHAAGAGRGAVRPGRDRRGPDLHRRICWSSSSCRRAPATATSGRPGARPPPIRGSPRRGSASSTRSIRTGRPPCRSTGCASGSRATAAACRAARSGGRRAPAAPPRGIRPRR